MLFGQFSNHQPSLMARIDKTPVFWSRYLRLLRLSTWAASAVWTCGIVEPGVPVLVHGLGQFFVELGIFVFILSFSHGYGRARVFV